MSDAVIIREVGLREGAQALQVPFDLKCKLAVVECLNRSGIKHIELTALVRADKVPGSADAETLIQKYERLATVNYSALYLNQKGFLRGEQCGRLDNSAWLYASVTDTFFRKNYGLSREAFVNNISSWQRIFSEHSKPMYGLMVSSAFACAYEGTVKEDAVFQLLDEVLPELEQHHMLPQEICFADTVGSANPKQLRSLVRRANTCYPSTAFSLHMHDTQGLGIANCLAGIEEGVRIFESSIGGLGGCPFAPGAAGNVATEELLHLCEREGLHTGIQVEEYFKAIALLEASLPKSVGYSKLYAAKKADSVKPYTGC